MKVESHVVSVSWLPAGSVAAWLRRGMEVGLADGGTPPVPKLPDIADLQRLRTDDRFRAANVLAGYAQFDAAGMATAGGYTDTPGTVVGSTTVRLPHTGASFGGYAFPVLRDEPVVEDGLVHLAQTFGGRCGVPLPAVAEGGHVWQAPIVWTTLTLTLRADGTTDAALPSASAFPRHWVYDVDGALTLRSGVTDEAEWVRAALTRRTPWGPPDSPAVAAASEEALGRQLAGILRTGATAEMRDIGAGTVLARAGEAAAAMYVLVDGVVDVERESQRVGVGAGAVLGEQEVLGLRPWASTLTARTPVRLAALAAGDVDAVRLAAVDELRGDREHTPVTSR